MIRKLRIKLILASMLSLLLVLAVIFGVVGVLSYRKIITDADTILTILQQNNGSFPIGEHMGNDQPFMDAPPKGERRFSPELPLNCTPFVRQYGILITSGVF